MYEEYKDRQRRDMWKAIPENRKKAIRNKIRTMQEGRDRKILEMAFVHGLTTTEIAEAAKNDSELESRNHKPISRRRIQQIILQYVPDANSYQDHSQKDKQHSDHSFFAVHHKKERCANCNSTERLEWHHMIPAALGGTAEPENMVCLCKDCHEAVTAYQRKIMPEIMRKRRKTEI